MPRRRGPHRGPPRRSSPTARSRTTSSRTANSPTANSPVRPAAVRAAAVRPAAVRPAQYGQQQYGQPQYGQPYGGYPQSGGNFAPSGPGSIAGLGPRLGGYLLDVLFVGVPLLIIVIAVLAATGGTSCSTDAFGTYRCTSSTSGVGVLVDLLAAVVGFAYFGYFIGVRGATLGQRIVGIRVQDVSTGQPIGIGRALLRYLVLAITGSICFLGFLSPLFDGSKRNRGWHDMAANDVVVTAK